MGTTTSTLTESNHGQATNGRLDALLIDHFYNSDRQPVVIYGGHRAFLYEQGILVIRDRGYPSVTAFLVAIDGNIAGYNSVYFRYRNCLVHWSRLPEAQRNLRAVYTYLTETERACCLT